MRGGGARDKARARPRSRDKARGAKGLKLGLEIRLGGRNKARG